MGINSAIGNAMSGLRASSRAAEIVARNIANAGVEGYTAKSLALSHEVHGSTPGGVRVDGVTRAGDPLMTAARRRDEALANQLSTESDALRRIADLALDPNGEDSLQSRYLALENALRGLADTPESAAMQREAARAARGVAVKLNALSTEAKRLRLDADRDIQRQVETVNTALRRIERLNHDIQAAEASGRDGSALEDERQRQIDVVNGIVPIRSAEALPNGAMHLATQGGQSLMNGTRASLLSFETSNNVQGSNDLGKLTFQGRPSADPARIGLGGGALEASFRVRDVHAKGFSEQLDALARDLVEGFQSLQGYATHDGGGEGLPGLFTDDGDRFVSPLDATDAEIEAATVGLAGRIALNAAVDPDAGGDPSLLRSGGFLTEDAADPPRSTLPAALYDRMRAGQDMAAADVAGGHMANRLGLSGTLSRVDMVTEFAALIEIDAGALEKEAGFRRGAAEAMREQELAGQAVDTDAELRRLLQIEKAYAANARVLQVADQMLATLLEM